jgi:predicted dehydrogenase
MPFELDAIQYQPSTPKAYRPAIGLVGCGGITVEHLSAYRDAGFRVEALCDLRREQAELRRSQFFPQAAVYQDYRKLIAHPGIEVVDVATHPDQRSGIIRDCLRAGKHVLSQKPFVTDLAEGLELVELASKCNVQLAVNQNGRWAPHFRYIHSTIAAGLLGQVFAVHLDCHWDHTWVRGTEFEKVRHLVLYDYAIHWFDIVRYFMGGQQPTSVFASTARVPGQDIAPNLLAQAHLTFPTAQASLVFDAGVRLGQLDQTYVAGTQGTARSFGPSIQSQSVEIALGNGTWRPELRGKWFPDAFRGTMGELLCSIEEGRECTISAADNIKSLEVCFAALASADSGKPVKPGEVRELGEV